MSSVIEGFFPQDHDNLKWLDDANCADRDIDDFFVAAGRVLAPEVRQLCETCPVRKQCVIHTYSRGHEYGYFGGFSPSERKRFTLEEALAVCDGQPAPDRPSRRRRNR
jgi:WhiB family redox-sensing transcriptional regulator